MVICLERGANDLHAYAPADATATTSSRPRWSILKHDNSTTSCRKLIIFIFFKLKKLSLNNSPIIICLSSSISELTNSEIPLHYLVADRSKAGRRPAVSWNLAYHLAR